MLPILALLFSCADSKDTGPAVDDSDSTAQVDSQESGHTGPDDTDDTDDTDTGGPPGEWIAAEVDTDRFGDQGYEIVTWTYNQEWEGAYDSPFEDLDPTFYMVRPSDPGDGTGPVLVWFHGGTMGNEAVETDEEAYGGCTEDKVLEYAEKTLENDFLPIVASMQRGWAVLIPRNDWCDYWTGQGEDDLVAPGERYGYVNVARMLDFVLAGQAGYPATGERYGWGTSAGGGAAIHVAAKYGGFSGIVADSSPSSMFLYWRTDPEVPERVFGGAPYDEAGEPTEYYERYAQASAETLISDYGFDVPIATTWNRKDTFTGSSQPMSLVSALVEHYTDVNFFEHDYNHLAPAPYYHTQSKWPQLPWGYTGQALMAFFDGKHLLWVEAEDGCLGDLASVCEVGALVQEETDADHAAKFSGGALMQGRGSEGGGVLWADTLPAELPLDTEITATLVVEIQGLEADLDPETAVGTVEVIEGETTVRQHFTAADIAPESGATTTELLAQYATTVLTFRIAEAGAGRIQWSTRAQGRTNLDAVIYSW